MQAKEGLQLKRKESEWENIETIDDGKRSRKTK
jgi:hypothetical protein